MIAYAHVLIVCGHSRQTYVERLVKFLGNGAGECDCLECDGSGVWDFMAPEIPADDCVQCKGTGRQLVSA